MADDDYFYTPEYQKISLALVPKLSGVLSFLGSSLILREVWLDRKEGKDTPTSRVLASLSAADLLFSTAWIISTWAAPSDLEYIWGNFGNQATCVAQAFIFQLGGVWEDLANISLAVFYLLIVRYNYNDRKLVAIERSLHPGILAFALLCSIYPIPLGLYNNNWEVCWFDAYPMGCDELDDIECERGENAWIHAVVFAVFPTWVAVLTAFVIMGLIFFSVRDVENRMSKYAGSQREASTTRARSSSTVQSEVTVQDRPSSLDITQPEIVVNRARSQQVAVQAMLYIGALLFCYSFDMVSSLMYYIGGIWYFPLDLVAFSLLPLQGFFNFFVFARTREMKSGAGKFVKLIVLGPPRPLQNQSRDKVSNSGSKTADASRGNSTRSGMDQTTASQAGRGGAEV